MYGRGIGESIVAQFYKRTRFVGFIIIEYGFELFNLKDFRK